MNTATTLAKMLFFTSALTLCLTGGTGLAYAQSNGAGDGLANDEAKHVYLVDRNQPWPDIAEGDDMGTSYENWGESPMSVPDVPETSKESQEFQGYESGA